MNMLLLDRIASAENDMLGVKDDNDIKSEVAKKLDAFHVAYSDVVALLAAGGDKSDTNIELVMSKMIQPTINLRVAQIKLWNIV
jgi:hypothetical protein